MKQVIDHLEKAIIIRALIKQNGSLKKAALFLGIEPATLSRKMECYSIQIKEFRDRTREKWLLLPIPKI